MRPGNMLLRKSLRNLCERDDPARGRSTLLVEEGAFDEHAALELHDDVLRARLRVHGMVREPRPVRAAPRRGRQPHADHSPPTRGGSPCGSAPRRRSSCSTAPGSGARCRPDTSTPTMGRPWSSSTRPETAAGSGRRISTAFSPAATVTFGIAGRPAPVSTERTMGPSRSPSNTNRPSPSVRVVGAATRTQRGSPARPCDATRRSTPSAPRPFASRMRPSRRRPDSIRIESGARTSSPSPCHGRTWQTSPRLVGRVVHLDGDCGRPASARRCRIGRLRRGGCATLSAPAVRDADRDAAAGTGRPRDRGSSPRVVQTRVGLADQPQVERARAHGTVSRATPSSWKRYEPGAIPSNSNAPYVVGDRESSTSVDRARSESTLQRTPARRARQPRPRRAREGAPRRGRGSRAEGVAASDGTMTATRSPRGRD